MYEKDFQYLHVSSLLPAYNEYQYVSSGSSSEAAPILVSGSLKAGTVHCLTTWVLMTRQKVLSLLTLTPSARKRYGLLGPRPHRNRGGL